MKNTDSENLILLFQYINNRKNYLENTVLHLAAYSLYTDCKDIDEIIQYKKILPSALNKYRQTALHIAAYSGNLEVCKILIKKYKLDLNQADYFGNTPLHYAVEHPYTSETTKYLLEQGADTNILNKDNKTALDLAIYIAIEYKHLHNLDILKTYIKNKPKLSLA